VKVSVIGCGYLGAVHAAAMAQLGHEVVAVDVDQEKISLLSSGTPPFYEPGLEDILTDSLASGRLHFTTDVSAIEGSQIHFIAVGTPQSAEGNSADVSFVFSAVQSIVPHLNSGDLVVGKSTVPVGTAQRLAEILERDVPGALLAWNPEFLREGFAVHDTLTPDRLVFGLPPEPQSQDASRVLHEVYQHALSVGTPVVETDWATAELVKSAANAFLATKISFINAMSEIAEATGANVTDLADALGHDQRIGRKFLNAGVGFGGGCLPKDIRAFSARATELGLGKSVEFLEQVDQINLRQRHRVVAKIQNMLGSDVAGYKVALLGLAFKPHSDDVRDSPALDVAQALIAAGADVVGYDPHARHTAVRKVPELQVAHSVDQALVGADIAVLVTEWPEFVSLDPHVVGNLMNHKRMVDARNVLDASMWREAGFMFQSMGRP
jgi:UDPglucose 6-dehydrogenase